MDEEYILEWLDTLVTVTLNPVKTELRSVVPEDIAMIRRQIDIQKNRVQSVIKSAVFSLNDEAKIKCLIKKYHFSLFELLDQAQRDLAAVRISSLKHILEMIVSSIDEVLFLIERQFASYLSIEARVSVAYQTMVEKDLSKKLAIISNRFQEYPAFQPLCGLLVKELESFTKGLPSRELYTFREISYVKDLCSELEQLPGLMNRSDVYTNLDELLICMNFNSRSYIEDLVERITLYINNFQERSGKIERLLLCQKLFKQFYKRPASIFHSKSAGVVQQVENWFFQAIFYLEQQSYSSISPPEAVVKKDSKNEKIEKIVANLSVDQMALILRATDDLRIITAHSLNSVFKNIVPHLSTPKRENISYNSMRGKAYSAESRDKEIVIEMLRQMIEKVSEY